ncbi:tyrosine-type recombinase/integrase [Candidatus Bipolaricaulota bacterium]
MVRQKLLFEEAVGHYMLYCRARGLAEKTIWTYRYALERLGQHMQLDGDGDGLPDKQTLRGFVQTMLQRGYARSTISIRMRAIRSFTSFLVREGLLDVDPMRQVEIPRVPERFPTILSTDEMRKLLRTARGSDWYRTRNYAVLATFCDTGLRLGELIGLSIDDVDLRSLEIRVRRGKGAKERRVYMGRALARAIRGWGRVRPFGRDGDAFFCTKDGRRLDARNVGRIVTRVAKAAGLGARRVHPHLLRHTFATHFIKNGGDPFSLQRLLGHSDIKTTMIYVNMAGADLEEAHAKASPVDRLSLSI